MSDEVIDGLQTLILFYELFFSGARAMRALEIKNFTDPLWCQKYLSTNSTLTSNLVPRTFSLAWGKGPGNKVDQLEEWD